MLLKQSNSTSRKVLQYDRHGGVSSTKSDEDRTNIGEEMTAMEKNKSINFSGENHGAIDAVSPK